MNTSAKGTALITGASSGIGAIYADRLAGRGHDLILVARNRERLEALATRLTDDTGRSVEVIVADLNDNADLARVEQRLRDDQRITMLVNNAGIGASGPFVGGSLDLVEKVIQLNIVAVMRLAGAAVPGFVAGIDLSSYPPEMIMEMDEMVDAALAGLDQGELVTMPSLPDAGEWDAFTAARLALRPNLSHNHPADRYRPINRGAR